ncbi:MAG: hypothetical protein ACRC35_14570 [Angustibacter sp.]
MNPINPASPANPWERGDQAPASAAQERAWRLFVDWCAATARPSVPAAPADVAAFLDTVPAAAGTIAGRLRAIRRTHAVAGHPDPTTPWSTPGRSPLGVSQLRPRLWRTGPSWLALPDALEQIDTASWPAGLRGRRDGFLLVLAAHLPLTRDQLRHLPSSHLQLEPSGEPGTEPGVVLEVQLTTAHPGRATLDPASPHPTTTTTTIATAIVRDPDPGRCPACAVTRWLRTATTAQDRSRAGLRAEFLRDRSGDSWPAHECRRPVAPAWQSLWQLLPAIDQHGWLTDWRPMTTRAISAVLAARCTTATLTTNTAVATGASVLQPDPPEPRSGKPDWTVPGRWTQASTEELLAALDQHVDAADEVLRRTAAAIENTEKVTKPATSRATEANLETRRR